MLYELNRAIPAPANGVQVGVVPAVLLAQALIETLASFVTIVEVQSKATSKFWEATTCALL